MATQKQIAANRQNAELSTGPTTPEGKQTSALNAVKTGLTGQTILLPTDDVEVYQQHLARFFEQYAPPPCGHNEDDDPDCCGAVTENYESPEICPQCARIKELTQSLADTQWRLNRIPSLEHGFYALGSIEFAQEFSEVEDPATRAALLQAKTAFAYQRQLSNLSVQEARLRRNFEKTAPNSRNSSPNAAPNSPKTWNEPSTASTTPDPPACPSTPRKLGSNFQPITSASGTMSNGFVFTSRTAPSTPSKRRTKPPDPSS